MTEKIFDCFYGGCVPVYLGAPDISDHIPKACYIDYRDFADYGKLEDYLINMTREEFECYRSAAFQFLSSRDSECFSHDFFAKKLLLAVEQCV